MRSPWYARSQTCLRGSTGFAAMTFGTGTTGEVEGAGGLVEAATSGAARDGVAIGVGDGEGDGAGVASDSGLTPRTWLKFARRGILSPLDLAVDASNESHGGEFVAPLQSGSAFEAAGDGDGNGDAGLWVADAYCG